MTCIASFCHSERQRRILSIPRRFAFPVSATPKPRKGLRQSVSFRIAFFLQICGFAGLYIVLSFISGTPLSSLVRRKLQRSTRRRGERNLPALRSTPLRAEGFCFRSSPAAQAADLPALLLKCFELEPQVLSPMKNPDTHFRRCSFGSLVQRELKLHLQGEPLVRSILPAKPDSAIIHYSL